MCSQNWNHLFQKCHSEAVSKGPVTEEEFAAVVFTGLFGALARTQTWHSEGTWCHLVMARGASLTGFVLASALSVCCDLGKSLCLNVLK